MVTLADNRAVDAKTARTLNIRAWVAKAGGPTDWSRRYSPLKKDGLPRWPQPQVAQWVSETDPKSIGGNLARDIEGAMGLPLGAMDAAPSQSVQQQRDIMRAAARIMERAREVIIGDVDEDALIDNAVDAALEIGPERILSGDGLLDALKSVAARIKAA